MCYSVYLSTNANTDLSKKNSDLLRFEKNAIEPQYAPLLNFLNHWFVGSKSMCSCTFRHLYSVELGFGAPVGWYPEDEDEIEATRAFIKVIRELLASGHQVDCIDFWEGTDPEDIQEILVPLGTLSDDQFRFFENHRFLFTSEAPSSP
jgi:hypothetical protein